MRIGTFLPQSLIDWPGRVSGVIFTKGCNFRCFYCHNKELVFPEIYNNTPDLNWDTIIDQLRHRFRWLDGVVITGGEPTIQPDLINYIEQLNKEKFPVKLDTNGSNPEVIEELLSKKLVAAVAMDLKTIPNVIAYQSICQSIPPIKISRIRQSVNLLKNSTIEVFFRTTVITKIHTPNVVEQLKNQWNVEHIHTQEYRQTFDNF